jgi:hypothetical protein
MGDPRATDNAWVESEVYWLHDSEGIFSDIPLVSFQDIPDRKIPPVSRVRCTNTKLS